MQTSQIISMLAKKTGMTHVQTRAVLVELGQIIQDELVKGSPVHFSPLGIFKPIRCKGFKLKNNLTDGATIDVPARTRIRFKSYAKLTHKVNQNASTSD